MATSWRPPWRLQRIGPRLNFYAGFRAPPASFLAARQPPEPQRVYTKPRKPRNADADAKSNDTSTGNGKLALSLAGALAMAGVAGYFFGVEVMGSSCRQSPGCSGDCFTAPTGRPTALLGISPAEFDRNQDHEEARTGITKMREQLAKQATGHVLEVAVGTGRNFGLYNLEELHGPVSQSSLSSRSTGGTGATGATGVTGATQAVVSFTGLDVSSDMLDVAATKVSKALPSVADSTPSVTVLRGPNNEVIGGGVEYLDGRVRLVKANALEFLPPPPRVDGQEGITKYDTVIQTFGLCSVSDPQVLVSNLARAVKPGTGRIILLEHGLGTWRLANLWLDRNAPDHFMKYGCWWNRNIESAVRDTVAGLPGVEITKIVRPPWQLGTVLWIELRVAGAETDEKAWERHIVDGGGKLVSNK